MTTETKIDFTKPVRTRDGREVRIFTTEARSECCEVVGEVQLADGWVLATWNLSGLFVPLHTGAMDLVNYEPEQFVYVNVYEMACGDLMCSSPYYSLKDADKFNTNQIRVGCLKIKLERRFDE